MSLSHRLIAATVAVAMFGVASARAADVLVIVDSSASMSETAADGLVKMEAAKKALSDLQESLRGHDAAMVLFGHRKTSKQPGACRDIEQVLPFAPYSSADFARVAAELAPKGSTPLAASLMNAKDILLGREKDAQKEIILITDGNETCGGNPAAVAAQIRALGINVRVHVVGFAVSDDEKRQLVSIAGSGGGQFVSADNAVGLRQALHKVVEASTAKSKKPVFFDEFDRDGLGENWRVLNADEDAYLVEDGKLLGVASAAAELAKGNAPNLFVLNKSMPTGDWTMTMKFHVDVQTAAEHIVFGLWKDKQNFTLAEAQFVKTWGGVLLLDLHAVKSSRGKQSRVTRNRAWVGPNGPIVEQAKVLPQPLFLRVEKRGRGYHVAGKVGSGEQVKWQDVGKVTALRARGNLAVGMFQRSKVDGESSIQVDWVKIESAE